MIFNINKVLCKTKSKDNVLVMFNKSIENNPSIIIPLFFLFNHPIFIGNILQSN